MRSLLFLCLFFLSSCLRETGERYYLHQDAKDFAIFQQGSRWVYQQASNAQTDTNTVVNTALEMRKFRFNNHTYESHHSTLRSSFYNENFSYQAYAHADERDRSAVRLKYDSHTWEGKDIFVANLQAGEAITESIVYVKQYPTYEVAGKTYTDVREFESVYPFDYTQEDIDKIDGRTPQRVWYARHVGIIKKQLFNGETWHLIQHEVRQ